jgi:hypothetical protein
LELLQRRVTALQEQLPVSNQDCYVQDTSLKAGRFGTALLDSSEEPPSSSDAATVSTFQNPTVVESGNLRKINDLKDINEILKFALEEKLDLNKVLIAGLRALESAKESCPNDTIPTQVECMQPQVWPNSGSKTTLVITDGVPLLPDLLPSRIFLRHQPILDVIHYNCQKIGLRIEELVSYTCQSPWYSPFSSLPSSLLPLDAIPPDLYPTPAQQRFPHHPFIDLIPFPWFRERAITLQALDPPAYDRWELKKDILNNGMVCWKSRAGDEGLPWDRRSWEVQPWFWAKWSWLVEEQDKVEQQSRWWRALRE